jgi:hypothetical protein
MAHALWALLALPSILSAQTDRATLTGTIVDSSDATVAGTTVSLKAVATGVECSAPGQTGSVPIHSHHALEAGLNRSLSTELLLAANYQWSHAIDDGAVGGAEATTPENINCRSCEKASSRFDMRSYFTSSAIWSIPVGKGHSLLGDAPRIMDALL